MMKNLKCRHDLMHYCFGTFTCNKDAEISRSKNRAKETVVATWVGVTHEPVVIIAEGS